MPRVKRADGLADSRLIHAITDADAQPSFRRTAGATRDHRRAVGACEDVTSLLEEEPARICKFDAALRAMEKRSLQLGLEELDLVTERWLRDVKRCRCLSEVQGLGDRHEVSQVSQLHMPATPGTNNSQKLLLPAQESIGPGLRDIRNICILGLACSPPGTVRSHRLVERRSGDRVCGVLKDPT
jgi:hypothetical protein